MGEIAYWSDRCGKIGPNNLKFGLGGYFGKEKKIYDSSASLVGGYTDDMINAWIAAFRYSVPIVPEKQGNKALALLLNGNFFIGQNVGGNNWMGQNGGVSQGSYFRPNGTDAAAPTMYGLFTQASFWFTDSLSINGLYGYLKYNFSSWARGAASDSGAQTRRDKLNMVQSYAVNILWDANQAIRFGIEWMKLFNHFNGAGPSYPYAGSSGEIDQYRFAAWYFF